MKSNIFKAAFSAIALLSSSTAAWSDDGGISLGGSPHLLSGHKSVSMKSEVVRLQIDKELVSVSCEFVFHNDGPASTVRMGFPDEGFGAETPYEGEPLPKNPHGTFKTYDSWVDGRKVPTKVVPTNDRSLFWHEKTVTFPANSDCKIVDKYTVKPGGQVTNDNCLYQQAGYVLHTGSSWHGPIGTADIIVTFAPKVVPEPIQLRAANSFKQPIADLKWAGLPRAIIICDSSLQPTVKGRTLTFHAVNLKPTNKDDIRLLYAYSSLANMPAAAK